MTDEQLLAAFLDATYPADQWRHRAHIRVAYALLGHHDLDDATDRIRAGIRALNRAHAAVKPPGLGYHETITRAFMRLVHALAGTGPERTTSEEFCARHPELMDETILLQFYTRDRLLSPAAKDGFVAPDIRPLPPSDAAARSATRLFVYGTLAPGRSNEHVLRPLGGTWHPARVRGHLHEEGWGAVQGFPAIELAPDAPRVAGAVLAADGLVGFWSELDEFEGEEYVRRLTLVERVSGEVEVANIYALRA